MKRVPTTAMAAAAAVLVLLVFQAGLALAQTPDDMCAADSLYLISPEALDLKLETTGKRGLTISWPNMDLSQATCFSLKDTTGLDFEVSVTGGFGDQVDRVFRFFATGEGEIGAIQPQNIIVTWQNEGPATYGNIGGKINLSNNGGIWRYGEGSDWIQENNQLPMYWLQANTVGLAQGSGEFLIAGFSRGVTSESDPVGLFTFDGSGWTQIATDVFGPDILIRNIAVSPTNNNMFAVGTERDGLFITSDGGQNFTHWTTELDPSNPNMPTTFPVNVVEWSGDRVYVFIRNYGLFISLDNGVSFTKSDFTVPSDLDSDEPEQVLPVINALSFHPTDPDRIAASLSFHGAYESTDGGVTWSDLYGDLVVSVPGEPGNWVNSALDVVYDRALPQTMVMGIKQKGFFRTTDGGATWLLVGDSVQPDNPGSILKLTMTTLPDRPGTILVLEDGYSILQSTDSGATWELFPSQPVLDQGFFLLADNSGGGDLIMGSWGGGLYVAGTPLGLSDTYTNITSPELRTLDLGLDIAFSSGSYYQTDWFQLICQTFQGWAVWRGASHVPEEMTLLGLFDRVNPEDCFEGYCGANSIEPVPNCFAAKRAACYECVYPDGTALPCSQEPPEGFSISDIDTIRFFDEEIYNGFIYNYSVTSFDYGNTARVTPENNSNAMLFSPRYEGDLLENGGVSPFPGPGNRTPIQINEPISLDEGGNYEEIYVVPNPLRAGAGYPRGEGNLVTFRNIPEGSSVAIYTTSGDRIINIGPESIQGGNIGWDTLNDSGESITSGVYLYKVDIPERESYWGRLVVIR